MKEFKFSVSAVLEYVVEAKTEKKAKEILIEKGGWDITYDEILVERQDYENAELVE
tara:strand:- start:1157 stop:1324 length:168 start_codon:yes stop_codon:yes gene_type:complete